MLDGQSNATAFSRPFENAWHLQTVEWLRQESYKEGMPLGLRKVFENEVQDDAAKWKEQLLQARSQVRAVIEFPGFHVLDLTSNRARF